MRTYHPQNWPQVRRKSLPVLKGTNHLFMNISAKWELLAENHPVL
jgi:hypothetical protein